MFLVSNTNFDLENQLISRGYGIVGGLDEVGRGALAGPVAAGLVVFPCDVDPNYLTEVTDSKKLSQKNRERLATIICRNSLVCEVAYAEVEEIDDIGIVPATKLAMQRAIDQTPFTIDFLIVDALDMSDSGIPHYSLNKADEISKTVAAASIVAKVIRDAYMKNISTEYPGYLLEKNKGYGTKGHIEAIFQLGPSIIHRKTFAPVSSILL